MDEERRVARKTEEIRAAGVRLTSPDRVLWPEMGITKRALAAYWEAVAPHALAHLRGRPLTLVRCPAGQEKACFVQRRATDQVPGAVRRVAVETEEGPAEHLSADSLKAVLSLVQIGVLELHTWGARRDRLDRPDRLILDLDPGPRVAWEEVAEAALGFRARLEALGLASFVKTTGGKGLHVVAPLARRHGWDEVRDLSRALAEGAARHAPGRFVAQASKGERPGRIYVDWLRNGYAATAVAAFSPRARPGAGVSTPITWDELREGAKPGDFTMETVPARLAALRADPWDGYAAAARQAITKEARAEAEAEG